MHSKSFFFLKNGCIKRGNKVILIVLRYIDVNTYVWGYLGWGNVWDSHAIQLGKVV